MNNKIFLPIASLFFCAALFLIWPTVHTIALRKALQVITAVIGLVLLLRSEDRYSILKSPWLVFLGMLFVWVVFHAGFISQNGSEAWSEFWGQWFPAYLVILSGIGLALASRSFDSSVFRRYLLVVFAAQPVMIFLYATYKSIHIGQLDIDWYGMLGADLKTSLTFSSDMLAAFACAKIFESYKYNAPNKMNYVWLLTIVLAIFVAIYSSSLNSVLLISASFILLCVLVWGSLKIKLSRILLSILILTTVISIYAASFIPAVAVKKAHMLSNAKVALDIDTYTNWINYPKSGLPNNDMGEPLPESFYLRAAYAQAGIRAALEEPWGYGVTRKAFERIVQKTHPEASIANAHNGYLNLSCAVGIPGLLLFLLVIISIFKQLHKSNSDLAHPAAWMIGIYVAHWALDAIERDHFFESYLFVIALLMTLTMNNVPKKINA